jgi:hypothetical protein
MAIDPRPCRNPDCEGEFAPASWLPVFCSDDCRQAWCLANGRDRAGEPVAPALAPIVTVGPHPDAGPPPSKAFGITHPAGVIPEEDEPSRTVTLAEFEAVLHAQPPDTYLRPSWMARTFKKVIG